MLWLCFNSRWLQCLKYAWIWSPAFVCEVTSYSDLLELKVHFLTPVDSCLSGWLILEVHILGLINPGYARKVWRNDELWLMTWHCFTGFSLVYYRVVDVPVPSVVAVFHICLSRLSLVLIQLLSSYVKWLLKWRKYGGHSCRYHSSVCTHSTLAGSWIQATVFWSW